MSCDQRSTDGESRVLTASDTQRTIREAIYEIADNREPGESVKAMLHRAARVAGISSARIKRLYYGEITRPAWHEVETLRSKAKERREMRARWRDIKRDAEIAAIRARLERLERDDDASVMASQETRGLLETSCGSLD